MPRQSDDEYEAAEQQALDDQLSSPRGSSFSIDLPASTSLSRRFKDAAEASDARVRAALEQPIRRTPKRKRARTPRALDEDNSDVEELSSPPPVFALADVAILGT